LPEKDSRLKFSITPETKWEDVASQIRRQAPELNHFDDNDSGRLETFFELRMRNMGGDDVTEGMKSWRIETDEVNGEFYNRRKEVIAAIVALTESPEVKKTTVRHKKY